MDDDIVKPRDILEEFIYLNPPELGIKKTKIIDRLLSGKYLLREYGEEAVMFFLDSDASIHIPLDYFTIFRGLDVLYGEQILYCDTRGLGKEDLFIIGLEKFLRMLDTKEQDSEELFMVLCQLGTTEIRKTLREHRITIGPWTYESHEKTLEL